MTNPKKVVHSWVKEDHLQAKREGANLLIVETRELPGFAVLEEEKEKQTGFVSRICSFS